MKKTCYRCGLISKATRDWCPDCGALLPTLVDRDPTWFVVVRAMLILIGGAIALFIAATLLVGCGPAFRAATAELSTAGAGGDINTMSEAGAGGRDEVRHGDAGQGNDTADAGGSGSAGEKAELAGGVSSGNAAGSGGRGMGAGGTSGGGGAPTGAMAGAAGAGAASAEGGKGGCLVGWRASTCDSCSTAPPPESGQSCGDVLDCYVAHPYAQGACDYAKPTMDLQVELARSVLDCRCGGAP